MGLQKSDKEFVEMNATSAERFVRQMVQEESQGPGDLENSIKRLSRRYGVTPSQLVHIRRGQAKDPRGSLLTKIRLAYLDHCERQIGKFKRQHQEAHDDLTQDLLAQAESLLSQIDEAKAKQGA